MPKPCWWYCQSDRDWWHESLRMGKPSFQIRRSIWRCLRHMWSNCLSSRKHSSRMRTMQLHATPQTKSRRQWIPINWTKSLLFSLPNGLIWLWNVSDRMISLLYRNFILLYFFFSYFDIFNYRIKIHCWNVSTSHFHFFC